MLLAWFRFRQTGLGAGGGGGGGHIGNHSREGPAEAHVQLTIFNFTLAPVKQRGRPSWPGGQYPGD